MSPGPRASAVTVVVAVGLMLLPGALAQTQNVATSEWVSSATASAQQQRHPTSIIGWNASAHRVTPGESVSYNIGVRSGTVAMRRTVRLLRADLGSDEWTAVRRERTDAVGRVAVRLTAPMSGGWKYRVRVLGTEQARAKTSKALRVLAWTPQPVPTPGVDLPPPPPAESLVYVTGDIGQCGGAADRSAALIDRSSGVLVATGDLAYPNGTDTDFANCYDPHYGALKDITFPVPGNHEYNSGASAYFAYFGSRVGTPEQPWYTVDIGTWRFYMLNSNCSSVGGCGVGSAQHTWLTAQLSGAQPRCTAAVWHHPRWSSGTHGSDPSTSALYDLLLTHGTDLLLTGHEHNYERFARLDATGQPAATGIRQFVVGTGGASLRSIPGNAPGSEVRLNDSHGVMRLMLGADEFSWRFQPTESGASSDAGSERCS